MFNVIYFKIKIVIFFIFLFPLALLAAEPFIINVNNNTGIFPNGRYNVNFRFYDGSWQYEHWSRGWENINTMDNGYSDLHHDVRDTLRNMGESEGYNYFRNLRNLTPDFVSWEGELPIISGTETSDSPNNTESQNDTPDIETDTPTVISPNIQVDILGVKAKLKTVTCNPDCEIGWIGQYISAIFTYGISLAIALSVVMIMVGGLIWLMSGGRQDQVGRAKEFITGALSGLFLALLSVIILQVINPELISFDPFNLRSPKKIVPEFESGGGGDGAMESARGDYGGVVDPGTHVTLAQIPGYENLNGSDPEFITQTESMISKMAEEGVLPKGIKITSGVRPGSVTSSGNPSMHSFGKAVDVNWPGINADNAQVFIDNARRIAPNFNYIREVTASEMARYGSTGPHVHIAFPRN